MHERLLTIGLVMAFVGSGLVLGARSQDVDDLDDLTPEQLERELIVEIDDLFYEQHLNPNGLYTDDDLQRFILFDLSDEGDDDDEDDVDYDELEEEMEESDTTVEEVVEVAIEEADRISYRRERAAPKAVSLVQNRPGTARAGTAACTAVRGLVTAVKRQPYRSNCRF